MRPLKGVVVDTEVGLTIRLESRALVRVHKQKDLRLGDTCYVLYNYTTLEVWRIWTEEEYAIEDGSCGDEFEFLLPPDWEPAHKWAYES